jgi:hypothetical protein
MIWMHQEQLFNELECCLVHLVLVAKTIQNPSSSSSSSSSSTAAVSYIIQSAGSSPGEIKSEKVINKTHSNLHIETNINAPTLKIKEEKEEEEVLYPMSSNDEQNVMNVSTTSYSSIVKRPYLSQALPPPANAVRKRPSLSSLLAEQNSIKLSSQLSSRINPLEGRKRVIDTYSQAQQPSFTSTSSSSLRSRKGLVDSNPMTSLLQSPESYSLQLSGYLLKRSHHARTSATWAKRFFVTQRWHLLYYKDSNASPDTPLAAIDLRCVRDLRIGDEVNVDTLGNSNSVDGIGSGSSGSWFTNFLGSSSFSSSSSSSSSSSDKKCYLEIVLSNEVSPSSSSSDDYRQNYLLKAVSETEAYEWHNGLLSLLTRYGCDASSGSLLEKKLLGGNSAQSHIGSPKSSSLSNHPSFSSSNSSSYTSAQVSKNTQKEDEESVSSTTGLVDKTERETSLPKRLGILASVEAVLNGSVNSSSSFAPTAAPDSTSILFTREPNSSTSSIQRDQKPSFSDTQKTFATSVPSLSSNSQTIIVTAPSLPPTSTTTTTTTASAPAAPHVLSLSSSSTSSNSNFSLSTSSTSISSHPNTMIAQTTSISRPRPTSDTASYSAILSACAILRNPPIALSHSITSSILLSQRERVISLNLQLSGKARANESSEKDIFALVRALGPELSLSVSSILSLVRSTPFFTQKLASEFVSAAKTFQFVSFLRKGPLYNVGPFPILALHSEAQQKLSTLPNQSHTHMHSSSHSSGDALFANAISTQLIQWLSEASSQNDLKTVEKALDVLAEEITNSISLNFDTETPQITSSSSSSSSSSEVVVDESASTLFAFLLTRICNDSFLTVLPSSVLLSLIITVSHRGRSSAVESLAMQFLPILESYWSTKLSIKKVIIDARIRRLARAAGSGSSIVEKALSSLLRIWSKVGFLIFDRLSPLLQADLAMPSDWRDKVIEARGTSTATSSASMTIVTASAVNLRPRLSIELPSQVIISPQDLVLLHSALQRVLTSCADLNNISNNDNEEENKKTLIKLSFQSTKAAVTTFDDSDEKCLLHFLESSSVINALCEVSFSSIQSINLTSSINTNATKRISGTQTLVALNRFDEARATSRQLKDCYNEAELEIPTIGISHSTLTDIFATLPHSIEAEIITLSKRLLILSPVLELASVESSALKEMIKKLEEDLKRLKEEEEENETKKKISSSSLTHIPTAVKQLVFASPPLPPTSSFSSSKSIEQEQYDAANAAARAVNTPFAYRQTISSSTPLAASNAARIAMAAASAAALSVNKAPKPPPTPFTSTFATHPKSPLSNLIGAGGVFSYSSQQK